MQRAVRNRATIREGAFDTTRLDGLGIALILRWPNPIHRGNGRCVVFIDERADQLPRINSAGKRKEES
jgi:hypothetical protein